MISEGTFGCIGGLKSLRSRTLCFHRGLRKAFMVLLHTVKCSACPSGSPSTWAHSLKPVVLWVWRTYLISLPYGVVSASHYSSLHYLQRQCSAQRHARVPLILPSTLPPLTCPTNTKMLKKIRSRHKAFVGHSVRRARERMANVSECHGTSLSTRYPAHTKHRVVKRVQISTFLSRSPFCGLCSSRRAEPRLFLALLGT